MHKPPFYDDACYQEKIVITGDYVRLFKYSRPIESKFYPKENFKKEMQLNLFQKKAVRSHFSLLRTKKNIIDIIHSNKFHSFITLTFQDHFFNYKIYNKKFKKFIEVLRLSLPDLKYFCVLEYTNINRVHFHMLTDINYQFKNKSVQFFSEQYFANQFWKQGFVKIKPVTNNNLGIYLSKYLSKSFNYYAGQKIYWSSRNLNKPVVYKGYNLIDNFILENDVDIFYSKEYNNKYRQNIKIEIAKFK